MLEVRQAVSVKIDGRLELSRAEQLGQQRVPFTHHDFIFADRLKVFLRSLDSPDFEPTHNRFVRIHVDGEIALPFQIEKVFVLFWRFLVPWTKNGAPLIDGPRARSSTVAGELPSMIKPPIITPSPLWTKPRVEMLLKSETTLTSASKTSTKPTPVRPSAPLTIAV
jgi:hypothetical protein